MSLNRPNPFLSKWAEKGKRFDVPDAGADTANGRADIQTGFPEITMRSATKGGVPPWGQDHNGILNKITEAIQWTQSGGLPVYDQTLSNKIGGYPKGCVLGSSKYGYVSYISMTEGNRNNPELGTTQSDFWIDETKPGNGWAVLTILSNDPNNISYLDGNLRLVTKAAGPMSDLYVSASMGSDDNKGTQDAPFATPGMAIKSVPDGGTATIHLYYKDTFSLMADNSMTAPQSLNGGWDIGKRTLTIQSYGDPFVEEATKALSNAHSSVNAYNLSGVTRTVIHIPVGIDPVSNTVTHGYVTGKIGGNLVFWGCSFRVLPGNITKAQPGSPFAPSIAYNFSGCDFSLLSNINYLYGGWGGSSGKIQMQYCSVNDDTGKFIQLGGGQTDLHIGGNQNDPVGVNGYGYAPSNAITYFQKPAHYDNFNMKVIGYSSTDGTGPIYAPDTLITNFNLVFD